MSTVVLEEPIVAIIPRWRVMAGKLLRNRAAVVGGSVVLALLLLAAFAPWIAPYDPFKINPVQRLKPPSFQHWFGTDEVGRDLLSRIIFGTRYFLLICLITASISATIGTLLGLIAGAGSALTDSIIMRIIDILLAFPYILLVLVVVAILGPSLWTGMAAVGIAGIPGYARLVRSSVLTVKREDYVTSARALGASDAEILFGTVLPNVMSPLIVYLAFATPLSALIASALSFAGLGTQPPAPEWGAMLVNSRTYLFSAWWAVAAPGMALFISIFGMNILGNGLRDVLDPRS
ncbi:peptide/nickel transport system permease protein [Rhizobium petrolearium]|uniref:ABC transporter permease n=1 Tax=Neorhizobium petrolearium TaxID=515361 RepID=UPI001AE48B7F|nr:ABC transporter permease [Neorhizobium petrolearium]MBP1848095.1 peptide/nickel transport system permease protein [Neorhizobium petrolearium]